MTRTWARTETALLAMDRKEILSKLTAGQISEEDLLKIIAYIKSLTPEKQL